MYSTNSWLFQWLGPVLQHRAGSFPAPSQPTRVTRSIQELRTKYCRIDFDFRATKVSVSFLWIYQVNLVHWQQILTCYDVITSTLCVCVCVVCRLRTLIRSLWPSQPLTWPWHACVETVPTRVGTVVTPTYLRYPVRTPNLSPNWEVTHARLACWCLPATCMRQLCVDCFLFFVSFFCLLFLHSFRGFECDTISLPFSVFVARCLPLPETNIPRVLLSETPKCTWWREGRMLGTFDCT